MSAGEEAAGDRVRRLLASADPSTRRGALEALAALPAADACALLDDASAAAVLAPLASERRSEQRRAADVLHPLVAGSAPLRAALEAALGSANARLRWGAAYTLGRGGAPGPELWPAARETLALDDGDQRWAAAELACAVARNHPPVLDEIRSALRAESATLRKMSLYCLRDLGVADAPAVARELLADPDAGVRLAALSALARTEPGSADAGRGAARVLPLVLGDRDAGVRRAAAATLGKLGIAGEEVLAMLRAAAREDDPSLARAARAALGALAPAA